METQIETLLEKVIPHAFKVVQRYRNSFTGKEEIRIMFAASSYEINNVKGQYPAKVSLLLEVETLKLQPQIFGGLGGQSIHRLPNKENPEEKYLALKSIRIPFRKPKAGLPNVMKAIETFALNWKKAIGENLEMMPPGEDWAKAIQ